eukprot:7135013-Heterocapsa_arctica.AAC.1
MIPWRWCPLESNSVTCGCCIPASFTVCPYCITPLVFTPAPTSGAVRRMPVAAAAVETHARGACGEGSRRLLQM